MQNEAQESSTSRKDVVIYVNTRPHEVDGKTISYEEVVALAFPGRPPGPEEEYLVSYSRGAHGNGTGTLLPGESVKIKKGMIFNVQLTTRS